MGIVFLILFAAGIVAYQFLKFMGHPISWVVLGMGILAIWHPIPVLAVALAAFLINGYFEGQLKKILAVLALVAVAVGGSAIMMNHP